MALIGPDSTCAICRRALDRPYTATSGVAFLINPRLLEYCDAPLHLDCLAGWADREEFSRGYFVSSLATYWSNYGTLLNARAEWFLGCGPAAPGEDPYFAQVVLASWPFPLYSKWDEWDAYVAGGFRRELVGPALDAADAVMVQVRDKVPSLEVLKALHAEVRGTSRPAIARGVRQVPRDALGNGRASDRLADARGETPRRRASRGRAATRAGRTDHARERAGTPTRDQAGKWRAAEMSALPPSNARDAFRRSEPRRRVLLHL
jgi:hypothetical protein